MRYLYLSQCPVRRFYANTGRIIFPQSKEVSMNIFSDKDREKDTHAVAPIPERLRKNEKMIIITANNTEDLEFFYPYYRLTEEGYTVDVVTPKGGKLEAKHGLGLKNTKAIGDVWPQDY